MTIQLLQLDGLILRNWGKKGKIASAIDNIGTAVGVILIIVPWIGKMRRENWIIEKGMKLSW